MTKSELIRMLRGVKGNPELRFLFANSRSGKLNIDEARRCRFVGLAGNGVFIIGEDCSADLCLCSSSFLSESVERKQEAL